MGWYDSHLHAFRKGRVTFGDPEHFEFDPNVVDEATAVVATVLQQPKDRCVYEYDFGDGWEHDVLVETVLADITGETVCLAGRRACPPEDCGGPHGYMELLEILGNPEHEEHAERLQWCGPLEPEAFDIDATNSRLRAMLTPPKQRLRRGSK